MRVRWPQMAETRVEQIDRLWDSPDGLVIPDCLYELAEEIDTLAAELAATREALEGLRAAVTEYLSDETAGGDPITPEWYIACNERTGGKNYPGKATLARALAGSVAAPECEHEWIDARNEVVINGRLCLRCNAVEEGPPSFSTRYSERAAAIEAAAGGGDEGGEIRAERRQLQDQGRIGQLAATDVLESGRRQYPPMP